LSCNCDRTAVEIVDRETGASIATFREDFLPGRDVVHGFHRGRITPLLDQWQAQIEASTDEIALARHRCQTAEAASLASLALGTSTAAGQCRI
jgi:hypothetical protein